MKVIYVAGLYHSGSTLLDLLLGGLDNVVGLGEIYKGFRDGLEEKCSCGEFVENCDFWKAYLSLLNTKKNLTLDNKYDIILSNFVNKIGSKKILVDSSKCNPFHYFFNKKDMGFNGLPYYIKNNKIDLKVIYLIGDVRSWSYGLYLRDQREIANTSGLRYYSLKFKSLFRTRTIRYLQWYVSHRRIKSYLKVNNIIPIYVSYEELALYPKETIESLCNDLGIEFNQEKISIKNSKSHIAVGNPMRNNINKIKDVRYDLRWLKENQPIWNIPFFTSLILKFNKDHVYTRVKNV